MDTIFKQNKDLKQYYKTSDGHAFYNENAASNHAKMLKDKSIEKVERKEETKSSEDNTEKPLNKMNLKELQEKCTSLGITFNDETKADLKILIEDKLAGKDTEAEKGNEDTEAEKNKESNENKQD